MNDDSELNSSLPLVEDDFPSEPSEETDLIDPEQTNFEDDGDGPDIDDPEDWN